MIVRLTLKQLAASKRRVLSTAAAVVLGVGLLAGMLVLTDTVRVNLDGLLADGNAGTDALVRAPSEVELSVGQQRPTIDAALVERVAAVDGVAAATPRVSGYAQVVGPDGSPIGNLANGAPIVAQNWVADQRLGAFRLAEGRAPQALDEIVIDRGTAKAGDLHAGDRVTVLTRDAPATFTISGVARFGKADSMGGIESVLFHPDAASRYLTAPGRIEGVAAVAEAGISQAELAARLRRALGDDPAVEVVTGKALTAEDQNALHHVFAPFNTFLLVFAGVALFVGAFIINNTFSILVAQRTRETALLRSLGASRGQITGAVIAESVALGGFASVAGLGVGVVLARGMEALMGVVGMEVYAGSTVVAARTVVASVVAGLTITVLAALLPARRAAHVAPLAALRSVGVDHSSTSRVRAGVGLAVTALGAGAVMVGLSGSEPALVGLGAAVTFLGVATIGPVLVRPFVSVMGRPLSRLLGVRGALASQNALRNPKRTARTAAALMTGVGIVGFVVIFAASSKASIAGSAGRQIRADFVVDTGSFDGRGGLSQQLAATLRATPGVATVGEARVAAAQVGGRSEPLHAWDTATVGRLFDLGSVEGSLTTLGADGLAVERSYAAQHGWQVGDRVPVTFADGKRTFTVRALFTQGSRWVGKVFVGLDAQPDQLDYRVYVSVADRGTVAGVAGAYPAANVLDKAELVQQMNADIDKVLGLIYAMLGLAVVIALLGIANTMALSIHERTRELGLLRAVGMERGQLRAAVRWEAVLVAVFGTALGLGIGVFFGWAMVSALDDQGIDRFNVPAGQLAAVTVIAALSGLAAAVLPARRAARLDILTAVAA